MSQRYTLSIGNLCIALLQAKRSRNIRFDGAMQAFMTPEVNLPVDLQFEISDEMGFPSLDDYQEVFVTKPEGIWSIHENKAKDEYLIVLQNEPELPPYQMVSTDRTFSKFTLYPGKSDPLWFGYPLDEMSIAAHANINRIGIILHAACVSIDGKGYLFAGTSGAGKSTISEIWSKVPKATVVTDERVLIREQDGAIWAYGTPWHGTAHIHKNLGVQLQAVFFIQHGTENKAGTLSAKDVVNRLMVRCFPTFWHKEGMSFSLEFCNDIAERLSCYQLSFVPDINVTDYIRKI
jgi:hypothetical protein